MGYVNVAALKYDLIKPDQRLDVPDGIYQQSLNAPFDHYPMSPLTPTIIQDTLGNKADNRFHRACSTSAPSLYTGNSWHTSATGTLILTTDYLINLYGYQPFGSFPLKEQAMVDKVQALTGDTLIDAMANDYRKRLLKARASLKNNGFKHMTSTRKLIAYDANATHELPHTASTNTDLTGFFWINYDHLNDDNRPTEQHLRGDQWQTLILQGRNKAPGFGSFQENEIPGYHSLFGPATLDQSDVLVIQYSHLVVWHSVMLKRNRRTSPEALYPDHLRHNDSLGTVLSMEYPLMREFFASQGVRVQL